MCYTLHHRGGVRGDGRRGEGGLVRARSVGFLTPGLGSPSIGEFEDNKGAIDLANH